MSTQTIIKPFSIKVINNGREYNFHGFAKPNNRPEIMIGYGCLNKTFYWRIYQHIGRAVKVAEKVKKWYFSRGIDYRVVVYDNINKKIIIEV